MWELRRLYRRLARADRFDVAHQLNPVDVGVSLALAGDRTPLVLGPYYSDWAPSGPGADARVGLLELRLKRVVRAAQQRRAATLLLSTPAAAAKRGAGRPRARARAAARHRRPRLAPARARARRADVLFLANLEVRKGIHVLLDAFEALAPRLPDARLQVAGDGPEQRRRAAPDARIASARSRRAARRVGPRTRPGAHAVLRRLLPAILRRAIRDDARWRRWRARGPWSRRPRGASSTWCRTTAARKVPPGDAAALAGALAEVLGDPALRRAMGERNRAVVEERFAWPRVVDRLEELYEEAIAAERDDASAPERAGGSRTPAPGRR